MELATWLCEYWRSEAYARKIKEIALHGGITPAEETAFISEIIERLQPVNCLEIGTFFASTARIMAEAMINSRVVNPKLVTLDPFGAERLPGILASWPPHLASVIDFHAKSSMDYFMEMEIQTLKAPVEFGLVFVDGHHNFEYALFDLIRSASHIGFGGVIIVDNIEQMGPRQAVHEFLRLNKGWKCFYRGEIYSSPLPQDVFANKIRRVLWCVLLAPDSHQISSQPVKLTGRKPYAPIRGITFNMTYVSAEGALHFQLLYNAVPYDFHITGTGATRDIRIVEKILSPGASQLKLIFEEPLQLVLNGDNYNVGYQLELRFVGEGYIQLDQTSPFEFIE